MKITKAFFFPILILGIFSCELDKKKVVNFEKGYPIVDSIFYNVLKKGNALIDSFPFLYDSLLINEFNLVCYKRKIINTKSHSNSSTISVVKNKTNNTYYVLYRGNSMEGFYNTISKEVSDFFNYGTDPIYAQMDMIPINNLLFSLEFEPTNIKDVIEGTTKLLDFHYSISKNGFNKKLVTIGELDYWLKDLTTENIKYATYSKQKLEKSINYLKYRFRKGASIIFYSERSLVYYEIIYSGKLYLSKIVLDVNNCLQQNSIEFDKMSDMDKLSFR